MKAWQIVGESTREGAIGSPRVRLLDALDYATGSTICRVECNEDGSTVLWRIDGERLLRKFGCMCASDVLYLWDAPDVVRRYLRTGDNSLRAAAWEALGGGGAVTMRLGESTASVVGAASTVAAAMDAARVMARSVPEAAEAARTAVKAMGAAAWAAEPRLKIAAEDDARAAARDAQDRRLTRMVHAAHRTLLAGKEEK